jgi:tellurite resistance protein TerC
VLGFIGVKMLIMDLYKIPITVSIAIIFCLIAISIAASVIIKQPKETPTPEP